MIMQNDQSRFWSMPFRISYHSYSRHSPIYKCQLVFPFIDTCFIIIDLRKQGGEEISNLVWLNWKEQLNQFIYKTFLTQYKTYIQAYSNETLLGMYHYSSKNEMWSLL